MVNIGEKIPFTNVRYQFEDKMNVKFEMAESFQHGRNLIYFFPAAFTGVCTASSCQLRNDIKEFEQLNANLFGISTDSPFVLREFAKSNELNYPLLSDWNREAIDSFGVRDDLFAGGLRGFAKRSLFLIEDGVIKFKWVAENPGNYPPFDEVIKMLN